MRKLSKYEKETIINWNEGDLRKNIGSAPAVLIGNSRMRILYPLLDYGRKCTDTEPAKLAKTASAVKASFAGAGVRCV